MPSSPSSERRLRRRKLCSNSTCDASMRDIPLSILSKGRSPSRCRRLTRVSPATLESSDERNQINSFSAKAVENILIDEKERLDRSCVASAINNRKISVLEVTPESIVQNLVIPIIFSLVGESRRPGRASGQFGAGNNGNRERLTPRTGSDRPNSAHLSPPQGSNAFHTPARCCLIPACGDKATFCRQRSCLHQEYISAGGRYRLFRSYHGRKDN